MIENPSVEPTELALLDEYATEKSELAEETDEFVDGGEQTL